MCCVVGTGINAVWLIMVWTEVASCGFHLHFCNVSAGTRTIFRLHLKGMHIDISIGTVVGAQTATDAPVLDGDFKAVASANSTHRAPDHAEWVFALAAGCGHEIVIETHAIANKTADAIVRISAGAHTLVTSSAPVEVEHQQALRFQKPLVEKRVHRHTLYLRKALAVFCSALAGDSLEAVAHLWKALEHGIEVFDSNTHNLDVIERGAVCGAYAAAQ